MGLTLADLRASVGQQFLDAERRGLDFHPPGGESPRMVMMRLGDWIAASAISVYISSPSLFRHFIKSLREGAILSSLRIAKLGAEQATSEDFAAFQKHFPEDAIFVHTLGCSEAGNIAALRLSYGDRIHDGSLAAGKALKGMEVLLVDDDGKPVPLGATGEVVLHSRYLSAGYWRNDALTAERFSADLDIPGVRIFRTGDLGRINADGDLELRGRKDSLLKIRGYRVEPSEIENTIQSLSAVEKAAVYGIEDPQSHATRLGIL